MKFFLLILAAVEASESVSLSSSFADCICDVTENSCDLFCCCDNDCSSLKSDWEDQDKCLSEKVRPPSQKCSEESQDSLEAGWRGMKVATDLVNRLFCVMIDNSPQEFNNFEDIDEGSNGKKYNTYDRRMGKSIQISSDSYEPGDLLAGNNGEYDYPWSLPRPDLYGFCTDGQPVQWLVSSSQTSCQSFLNISKSCSQMSFDKFTKSVTINGVTPTVTRIFILTSSLSLVETNPASSFPTTSEGCSCKNVVVQSNYTVFTTNQKTIQKIEVELVISNLTGCQFRYYEQKHSVRFLTNSSEVFTRSGNPGYQIGKPVFAGLVNPEKNVSYYENGFSIPGVDSAGRCSDSSWYLSPVLTFAEDLVVTCYLEMNYTELDDYCLNHQRPKLFFNNEIVSSLGKFGSIDPSYEDDWITIKNSDNADESSFSEGTCTLENTLVYYIVYANIGNARNPQNKIIYAEREYKDQTFWQFKKSNKSEKQRFYYTLTVTFIEYEKNTYVYYPPPPNPLPIMPDDILYPFKISFSCKAVFALIYIFL